MTTSWGLRPPYSTIVADPPWPFAGPYNVRSVQRWPQPTKPGGGAAKMHSAKPDASFDLIERVSPGPYVELFARRRRPGWDAWGDQLPGTPSASIESAS